MITTTKSYKTYSELLKIESFKERLEYLRLEGIVGEKTFGGHRFLNQVLYKTDEWFSTRREVIVRDNGMDLAHEDYPINGSIYIHHINPITIEDILKRRPCVFDLENLISCSFTTHNAIHYGNDELIKLKEPAVRTKNDTRLW